MKTINDIYSTIKILNKEVKFNLLKKGIVVPIQKTDGSIKIGNFFIKKSELGYYNIYNSNNILVIQSINLPQTAIIIANKLALGKWIDNDILEKDKNYGYAVFDEQVQKRILNLHLKQRNYEKFDIFNTKIYNSKHKKIYYKKLIFDNFRKLIEFR